ncbi:hypothetical protein DSO57_1029914 [Entomophthora muscae]|uniref:Uncharacterized protein n=1 Tax=Entomophthora muscae TaxID=34485 RepID=A0ACC2S2Y6_9FUNG|nr:hypothetical protein DSO57_1029914 [Entomophthora muscae]
MDKFHMLLSSQPAVRRANPRLACIESVIPEELVEQIRTTHFDEMLASGFTLSAAHPSKAPMIFGCSISTLKLTLTPPRARDPSIKIRHLPHST